MTFITSSLIEEIREIAQSGNEHLLDALIPVDISLPATVSLCLSLDYWPISQNKHGAIATHCRLLPPFQEAESLYLNGNLNLQCQIALFQDRKYEFFPLRQTTAIPSLDWDNYCQRFKKGLANNGFSTPYALALANTFSEIADNVIQHSQVGVSKIQYSGLAGYHISSSYMSFSVGDNGVGVLNSLRTNPRYEKLATAREALDAIARCQATRKPQHEFGGGFRQLFKSLADLNGIIRLRSGDCLIEYSGVSTRTADYHCKSHIPGLEVSVVCQIGQTHSELSLTK